MWDLLRARDTWQQVFCFIVADLVVIILCGAVVKLRRLYIAKKQLAVKVLRIAFLVVMDIFTFASAVLTGISVAHRSAASAFAWFSFLFLVGSRVFTAWLSYETEWVVARISASTNEKTRQNAKSAALREEMMKAAPPERFEIVLRHLLQETSAKAEPFPAQPRAWSKTKLFCDLAITGLAVWTALFLIFILR